MAARIPIGTAKHLPYTPGKIVKLLCADSQTLYKGDFVNLSSGKVAIGVDVTDTTVALTNVYGMNMKAIANSGAGSTTYTYVLVIEPGTKFIANYVDSTVNDTTTMQEATSDALPGTALPIICRGSGSARKWMVGNSTAGGLVWTIAANCCAIVDSLANRDTVGDLGGRLIFKIKNSILE